MGEISFSNHISNKKSALNSKAKLAGVAKHNLRKYHSQDYNRDNITLLYGTTNLMQDVKNVYRKEFDAALHEYNAKQTRPERRIGDYFEHVSETEQDMAVEVIIQCGDKKFPPVRLKFQNQAHKSDVSVSAFGITKEIRP